MIFLVKKPEANIQRFNSCSYSSSEIIGLGLLATLGLQPWCEGAGEGVNDRQRNSAKRVKVGGARQGGKGQGRGEGRKGKEGREE